MPDNPDVTEEVVIKEKTDKTVLYYILIGILVIGVLFFFFLQNQKSNTDVAQNTESPAAIAIEGLVKGVDAEKGEITIFIDSTGALLPTDKSLEGEERVLKIKKNTEVRKFVFSNNEEGGIGKSSKYEINISDVGIGDRVQVEYIGYLSENVLENVKNVTKVLEAENVNETKQEDVLNSINESYTHVKGKVISFDLNDMRIEYNAYTLDGLSEETSFATLEDEGKVFVVDEDSRVNLDHARTESSFFDIRPEEIVYIGIDKETNPVLNNLPAKELIFIRAE